MTIPDEIKHAYLAIAVGSKPLERQAAYAIRWAVAGWLVCEYRLQTPARDWVPKDYFADADRLLREETKDG